jgi:ABC-2 type transport system permease protein
VSAHAQQVRRHAPSAFGDDLRRFFNLTLTLAATDFKLRYFGSALGYLWSLMRPLMLFGVLYLVFTKVVKLGGEVKHYPVYLLGSIMLWTYFAEATSNSVTSLVGRENLLRKMRFPRLVIPLSVSLTALFNLAMNMIAVFVFVFLNGIQPRVSWLWIPVLVLFLAILATGVAMTLSALYVRFRDIAPIWDVMLQIGFYASPILYVITKLPNSVEREGAASPIAVVMTQMRHALIDPRAPTAAAAIGGSVRLLIPIGLVAAIFALGVWVFHREAPRIAENL